VASLNIGPRTLSHACSPLATLWVSKPWQRFGVKSCVRAEAEMDKEAALY